MKINTRLIGLISGPLLFVLVQYFIPIDGLSDAGKSVLACTLWVAIWWMTEAIPVEATSLMPIVLLPLTGSWDIKSASAPYANPIVFLFLGGFIIAIAIERWNLHKRIALSIVDIIGINPRRIILGFMVATGFISMWISNTATTLMMVPIGLSVISSLQSDKQFAKALLLAIAYSASIGGMATLVGTPPNIVFAGVVRDMYGVEVSFFDWMLLGVPFSALLIFLSWIYISRFAFKIDNSPSPDTGTKEALLALGKMSKEEKRVLLVFLLTAFGWIFRSFLLSPVFPALDDTLIALLGALTLFLVPNTEGGKLLDWKEMKKLPWGVLLLFGGGLSIAGAFVHTDAAQWFGNQLGQLNVLNLLVLILIIAVLVNFLTEITSNVATASMILPIVAALSMTLEIHPYYLMVAAVLSSSCAFMLPVATPPNAIVFASGKIKMKDMIKTGLAINFISIILVTLFVYFVLPNIWDLQVSDFNLVTK